jgi:hypothetical protein
VCFYLLPSRLRIDTDPLIQVVNDCCAVDHYVGGSRIAATIVHCRR